MKFAFEYTSDEKIRAGFIGCGGHSYRNLLPCLAYAPVDLVATCDLDAGRAAAYARLFGAERSYADHREMLARERLDAVFIAIDGRYAPLVEDAAQAGCHVWIEKPPAVHVSEIRRMQAAGASTGKFVMVGFKRHFFPAYEKAREIAASPEFGGVTSVACRYPLSLPPEAQRGDDDAMAGFLDLCHPASALQFVVGSLDTMVFENAPGGGAVALLTFKNGAVGVLHLAAGGSGTSVMERMEVVGRGANVVIDNGCRLTYYRPGGRGPGGYGRAPSFIGEDAGAPIQWEPEFSLGQIYNSSLFLEGFAQELLCFVNCVRTGTPPERGTLESAMELTRLFTAFRGPAGREVRLDEVE